MRQALQLTAVMHGQVAVLPRPQSSAVHSVCLNALINVRDEHWDEHEHEHHTQ